MKNKILGIFLIFILNINILYAQPESFLSMDDSEDAFPNNIQLQLGINSLYQKFSWQNNSNNLIGIFSQDYILNFTLKPNADDSMGFEGIFASDMGFAERNMLGLYSQEDFSNKQFLIDQQFTYTEGDISAGIHFLDIPEEMNFSSNLKQQLTERYNKKKIEDILNWQQMEYIVNFGQKDTDHLFLSYMTGEKQNRDVVGHGIDIDYNLFGELPISYLDSYHQDNKQIISRDEFGIVKDCGIFSFEFLQSENYIMPVDSQTPSLAEDIDKLVLNGDFDIGNISYVDSYHRTLKGGREVLDTELGWDAELHYEALIFHYSDSETKHFDSKNNQNISEDITDFQFTYDKLESDRYLLAYSNREGMIIRNGNPNIVDEQAYKIIYMINSDQKLSFDYIDAYNMNQYSLHLSPMIRYWPIGIAYINRDSESGKDMNRLALTFPQKNIGFMNVDASYTLQNFFTSGDSKSTEDIQINAEIGQVSVAAKKQKDETKDKFLDSIVLGWQGGATHAGWLYNRNNQQDNWSFEIGRQFGDDINTDYQLYQNENLQEHNFAFNWNIIENMNFQTNLNLREEELDSRKYSFNTQFSDESDLILEYFLNPINKKNQIQEGECYRFAFNYNFSDDLSMQYIKSNMSFDPNGNLLPTEEDGLRILFDLDSLKSEIAYVQSIDKRLNDKSRIEYMIGGDLGSWGNLSFKLFDYKEQSNFFDISLKHEGEDDILSFHAVSNPLELKEVDIGEEYQTFKYYLQYESEF